MDTVPALFDAAENILLKKDSESDWRAAVDFIPTVVAFTATTAAGARPDPVSSLADSEKHFDFADITFVNGFNYWDGNAGGVNIDLNWRQTIIGWNGGAGYVGDAVWRASIIAHEMGHGVGLARNHINQETGNLYVSPNLMNKDSLTAADNELTEFQSNAFDR